MSVSVKTRELFSDVPSFLRELFDGCEYPWQILPRIADFIEGLIEMGIDGYSIWRDGILVGKNTKIHPSAVICAPCIIGIGCEIRPGAYIRGNAILSDGCVLGNSSEVKNSIMLPRAAAPHFNYVGDSVLGGGAHIGAGVILSNLRTDGKAVVIRGECEYETGLRKVGSFLGDGADVGSGCVLNPGTVIGRSTAVYPMSCLKGIYPDYAIVKSMGEVVKKR